MLDNPLNFGDKNQAIVVFVSKRKSKANNNIEYFVLNAD